MSRWCEQVIFFFITFVGERWWKLLWPEAIRLIELEGRALLRPHSPTRSSQIQILPVHNRPVEDPWHKKRFRALKWWCFWGAFGQRFQPMPVSKLSGRAKDTVEHEDWFWMNLHDCWSWKGWSCSKDGHNHPTWYHSAYSKIKRYQLLRLSDELIKCPPGIDSYANRITFERQAWVHFCIILQSQHR